LEFFSSPPRP